MAKSAISQSIKSCTIDGCGKRLAARGMCYMHYARWKHHGDPLLGAKAEAYVPSPCCMDGCDRLTRSRNSPYCEMHYQRWWRKGTASDLVAKPVLEHTGGYLIDYAPGHPLATDGAPRYVYQHRRVYYEANGGGPFSCHHCGKVVSWSDMHVDHLDDDPANNEPPNLVASCPTCNQRRGYNKMTKTRRSQGVQVTAFGRTRCITEWANDLGISRSSVKRRLDMGWPPERAVSEPRGKFGPQSGFRTHHVP